MPSRALLDEFIALVESGDHAGAIAADSEALGHYHQAMEAYGRAFGDRWDPVHRASLERKIGEALFCRGEHHLVDAIDGVSSRHRKNRALESRPF